MPHREKIFLHGGKVAQMLGKRFVLTFRTVVLSESRDDVAEAEETHVDGDTLLVPLSSGAGLLGPLRASQVDQVKLDLDGVRHAFKTLVRSSFAVNEQNVYCKCMETFLS